MKEDFVTYDLAVKLKEKGFREYVRGHYKSKCHLSVCSEPMNCNGSVSGDISAPQIHEVLKWLREERGIFVEISPAYIDITFYVSVYKIKDGRYIRCCILEFKYKSYEQAALAGIEYVIDNLI